VMIETEAASQARRMADLGCPGKSVSHHS